MWLYDVIVAMIDPPRVDIPCMIFLCMFCEWLAVGGTECAHGSK